MRRADTKLFWLRLEDNIFFLHQDLASGRYRHGTYESFTVCDPKQRRIHKAAVRDRLLHHAVVRAIEPLFERRFIFDSWSCRKGKGTHRAVDRFQRLAWSLSRNNSRTVWVLKLDIRKYFFSVHHKILLAIVRRTIGDARTMKLIEEIVRSFPAGIPLGNLTSQLFANIYLNELDQFVKHRLRFHVYLRYGDDMVVAHRDRDALRNALPPIRSFLEEHLRISLHPDKIKLEPYHRGVDFLGFVCFPHFRVLRTRTKRRVLERGAMKNLASYIGLVRRARSHSLEKKLLVRYMSQRPYPRAEIGAPPPEKKDEHKWEVKPSEISPDLEEFVPEAKRFIEKYNDLFQAIARDTSIEFRAGPGFFIDLKKGVITLDVRDWKWAKERGLSEWQIIWSVCHEISHFYDLREASEELLGNFDYLDRRAKELEPQAAAILAEKFGGALPEAYTREIPVDREGKRAMNAVQIFLRNKLHILYNSLDDMYVNGSLGQRSAVFNPKGGSRAEEVARLYRDYLFPTHPSEIGAPPGESEAADYTAIPKSYQLVYSLLRKRMAPDQKILIENEVKEALLGFADEAAKKLGITLEKEVNTITSIATKKAKSPGWRYQRIREAVEPVFIKFLLDDLKKFPPPAPPDEEVEGDPWEVFEINPEPIDSDTVSGFIKQKKEKEATAAAAKKAAERKARTTPEARAAEAQKQEDIAAAEKYGVGSKAAEHYRRIEEKTLAYQRELMKVFEEIMNTVSMRISRFWAEGFRSGKFNLERFAKKYGPELAAEQPELIPWERLDIYDQREIESRIAFFPDRIRVRLVVDGSGSMAGARQEAAQEVSVLFLEALSAFEAAVNLRFRLKEPFRVETEIWMFGSAGASKVVKTGRLPKDDEERADRFRSLGEMTSDYGGTCDAESFWKIADSIDSAHASDLKLGKAKEFIFEITDGGSNETSARARPGDSPEQDTRNAIAAVEEMGSVGGKPKGIVMRGLQIGMPNDEERATFDRVWGKNGAHIAELNDLAPEMARLLARELRKTDVEIQYYGEEED